MNSLLSISSSSILSLTLLLFLQVPASMLQAISGKTAMSTYYQKILPDGVELLNPTRTRSSEESLVSCTALCNADATCTMLSYTVTSSSSTVTCKLGSTNSSSTRNVAGASTYYKVLVGDVDLDGFSTSLDPFRYKYFDVKSSRPSEVQDYCLLQNASIPVTYPSGNSFRTMRQFMASYILGPSTVFVGITYAGNLSNGTMKFMTLRDWPIHVNPSNIDPAQPWAPGQPNLPPHSQPSDLAVMMSTEGWFVVNVASGAKLGDGVICMRHTVYQALNITNRFYKKYGSGTQRSSADVRCKQDDAFLARAYYRPLASALLDWFNKQPDGNMYWLAGTRSAVDSNLWVFPDGLTLNASQRSVDERQVWINNNAPDPGNCIAEYWKQWGGTDCTLLTRPSLCEGGF